jgi:hypothetical protein
MAGSLRQNQWGRESLSDQICVSARHKAIHIVKDNGCISLRIFSLMSETCTYGEIFRLKCTNVHAQLSDVAIQLGPTHLSHRKSSHESKLAPSITAPVAHKGIRLLNVYIIECGIIFQARRAHVNEVSLTKRVRVAESLLVSKIPCIPFSD